MWRYSREDIRNWLKKWLTRLDDPSVRLFMINGTLYEFCFYFRIAFKMYGIYQDTRTKELIWFVYENDSFTDEEFLKAPRFKEEADLTEYIIDTFYKKWNQL